MADKTMTMEDLKNEIRSTVNEEIAGPLLERAEKFEKDAEERAKQIAELQAKLNTVETKHTATLQGFAAGVESKTKTPDFGRLAVAALNAHAQHKTVLDVVKQKWPEDEAFVARVEAASQKALTTDSFSGGGALVPEDFSDDFIEYLRPEAVLLGAGPRMYSMPNGNLTIEGQTGAATASWIGEAAGPNATKPTFGQPVVLRAHKAQITVGISKDLLRYGGNRVQEIVQQDAVEAMANHLDTAFFTGTGSDYSPKGLLHSMASSNKKAQTGTTLPDIIGDSLALIQDLEGANVKVRKGAWFMAPRTVNGLLATLNARNDLAFYAVELMKGNFLGYPVYKTNNIPTNIGASTSYTFFATMDQVAFGDAGHMEVEVAPNAAIKDESGNVIATFSDDILPLKVLAHVDFALRHSAAAACITGVTVQP